MQKQFTTPFEEISPQELNKCLQSFICQQEKATAFRIRILLFLSCSFGIETKTTFIHFCSSLKNHTRFQTKMGKVYKIPVYRPKWRKNPTRWGGTYVAYIRESGIVMVNAPVGKFGLTFAIKWSNWTAWTEWAEFIEVFIRNTGKMHGRKYAFLGEDSAVLQ